MKLSIENDGLTLLELLIILAFTAFFSILVGEGGYKLFKKLLKARHVLNVEETLNEAYLLVQRVGRVSELCEKVSAPIPGPGLYCKGAYGILGDVGRLSVWVRYIIKGNSLVLEQDLNNDMNFSSVKVIKEFPSIRSFVLCNDTDLETNACPIAPVTLSQLRAQCITVETRNRFYRFAFEAVIDEEINKLSQRQGSFFRRNPMVTDVGTISQLW